MYGHLVFITKIKNLQMTYQSINEFTATTNSSKSSIYRFYKENQELFTETIKKGKRMFPKEHARYFNSQIMFDENKNLRKQNICLTNLINCLGDKDSLQSSLWYKEWTFFCTVSYKNERNQISCFKQIHALYNHLESKYLTSDLRLFFTTEKFSNRTGYHNHFIIYVSDRELHEKVIKDIKNFFPFDITDIQTYDRMKAGIFYISKNKLVGEDWDLLGNNLKELKKELI